MSSLRHKYWNAILDSGLISNSKAWTSKGNAFLNGNLQIPDVRQIGGHSQSKTWKVAWNYFPETDKNVSNGIIYDLLQRTVTTDLM